MAFLYIYGHTITIQLFDGISNAIILNESYIGYWNNPEFEFACTNQSISCTINNALPKVLNDIVYKIAINSPTLKTFPKKNNRLFKDLNKYRITSVLQDTQNLNNTSIAVLISVYF